MSFLPVAPAFRPGNRKTAPCGISQNPFSIILLCKEKQNSYKSKVKNIEPKNPLWIKNGNIAFFATNNKN